MNKQQQRIIDHLETGRPLSRLTAWAELGILEAPARISELRRMGYQIITELIPVNNRYGESVKIANWRLCCAQSEQ